MKPGSIIVDLASENGGNCELTKPGEIYLYDNKVTIIGYTDLPSRLPTTSSSLYSNNIAKLFNYIAGTIKPGEGQTQANISQVDINDDVVRQSMVLLGGELKWPPPPIVTSASELKKKEEHKVEVVPVDPKVTALKNAVVATSALLAALAVGGSVPNPAFLQMFGTFTLSCIVGYQVVWGVAPALHSPLMSVTNAVSGIIIVGGMHLMGGGLLPHTFPQALASLSVAISSLNIFGGFLVT